MRDRVCPIEECSATVRFEDAVAEVTPRYRLHDLEEVDEFASCPACDAAVAGFYPEDEDEGEVELILDIDDDGEDGDDDGNGDGDGRGGDGGDVDGDGFDVQAGDFDDPEAVLDEATDDDEEAFEPVFESNDDE